MKYLCYFSLFISFLLINLRLDARVFWCFQIEKNSSVIHDIVEVKVKYKDTKDKWKRLKNEYILYGNQPELGYPIYYQLSLPNAIKEFELQLNSEKWSHKIVFYSIPDTIKDGSLLLMNNINTGSGKKRIPFLYTISKVFYNIDSTVYTLDNFRSLPSLKSEKNYYNPNSPIKIDFKAKLLSSAKLEKVQIPGCGAPGTRYIVQKWENGRWLNVINTWEYKCITTYHELSEHKFAIQLEEKGCYRLFLIGIKGERGSKIEVYSNIFFIR